MTDQYTEDQEVELHDDVENEDEIAEAMHGGMKKKKMPEAMHMHGGMKKKKMPEAMGHDPKNAEAQSVASVDKAGDATGKAPLPSQGTATHNTKQDPMPKTKSGMINAMYHEMNKMKKKDLMAAYGGMMKQMNASYHMESVEAEETELQYQADFTDDLNALINDEATLSEEFKTKAETIFEAAIKHKLSEEIDRLEAKYDEELSEELESTKADMVEKVDSYLNYVVEQWMEDNQVAIQSGLRAEIAEDFMTGLKGLFEENYIEVPESKVDLVDDLADTVEELEDRLNDTTAQAITMAEELEQYKRDAIIRESARDLAETQVEKLKSLVEDIDFEDEETFAQKVETVKESYFNKEVKESAEAEFQDEQGGDSPIQASGSMASYLSALEKTAK
mgnify:CR=1 FL=1|tara:strand:+ start:189 stop:1361 length:1173 start_codon:yes stop_codon:yes gene_type:complete